MTRKQAIEHYRSRWWEVATDKQIVSIQLFTKRLIMPFDIFHAATEKVLNRPIWTHQFAEIQKLRNHFYFLYRPTLFERVIFKIAKFLGHDLICDDDV